MSEHFIWNCQEERNGLKIWLLLWIFKIYQAKNELLCSIFLKWKIYNPYFLREYSNSLYQDISEDYLLEFKLIFKGDIKILMDNHHVP